MSTASTRCPFTVKNNGVCYHYFKTGAFVRDTSLKAVIQGIAKAVGTTPAALYERQRALVRAGLLQSKPGRGPGSGVRATPESVAMLLISILATGNLSETEERSRVIADLKSETKSCPITRKKTFAAALTTVLASEELSERLAWIHVERSGSAVKASLTFRRPPEEILTEEDFAEMKISRERRTEVLKKRGRHADDSTLNTISTDFGHKHARFVSMFDVKSTLHMPFEWFTARLKEVKEDERQHHPTRKE
jgi:hypothetical protein